MARETKMALHNRAREILRRLREEFPHPETALVHRNAFELLISTILSAQCTDERVNKVTPALFEAAPTPEIMAKLGLKKMEHFIKSINFFHNKARNILACCQILVRDYQGQVPATLDELVELPGVGRKTANVVLGNAFDTPRMVVDTHVQRLSNRLKFTRHIDPVDIEHDLEAVFDASDWVDLSHLLIFHGRKTCKALGPLCEKCVLVDQCPSRFKPANDWKKKSI